MTDRRTREAGSRWVPTLRALALLATLLPMAARAEDPIVVGATVPLTGTLASSGLQYYDSLQMAQDDINAAGGIGGRKLQIVFEDTQASNSTAVNAFIKLAQQQKPAFVFLSSYTVQNLAVEQAVKKAQIPTMYGGGGVAIADHANPWMFRIRPPDNLAAEAIATGVVETLHGKHVGILQVQDDYGTASANAVAAALAKAGVELVGRETYSARDNDVSPQLLALKSKGADVLIAFSYVRDGALVLTQRRALGVDMPMIGNSSYVFPSLLDLVTPDDTKGLYGVLDAVLGAGINPASADYVKRFTARFGMRPDPYGSSYYDAAMILAGALRAVGTDPEKLRGYFAAVHDYDGVTRRYTTDARGDMAHSVVLVKFAPGTKDVVAVARYPAEAP